MSFESPVYSLKDLHRRNNGSPHFFSQFNSAQSCARKRPKRSSSLPNETLHPLSWGSGRRNTITGSVYGFKGEPEQKEIVDMLNYEKAALEMKYNNNDTKISWPLSQN